MEDEPTLFVATGRMKACEIRAVIQWRQTSFRQKKFVFDERQRKG